jgi:hypothetical protein
MSRETRNQVRPIKWSGLGGNLVAYLAINHTNHNPQAHYDNNGMRGKAHRGMDELKRA